MLTTLELDEPAGSRHIVPVLDVHVVVAHVVLVILTVGVVPRMAKLYPVRVMLVPPLSTAFTGA